MEPNHENKLSFDKTYLIYDPSLNNNEIMDYIKQNFYGKIFSTYEILEYIPHNNDIAIYMCYTDVNVVRDALRYFADRSNISFFIVKDFLDNTRIVTIDINDDGKINVINDNPVSSISVDEIPMNIQNVGVFVKSFFPNCNYFDPLTKEHEFQKLTESNKVTASYRKGIYITDVSQNNDGDIAFKLLRCSTNLEGPTDNFRKSDHDIIRKVKNFCKYIFTQEADLNHVLAQVYDNQIVNGKNKKAKISAHSDKTKDMTENGVMAFCSFYSYSTYEPKKLTHLKFKRKNSDEVFNITLYPNSIFLMPLSTNRLYTHEIFPSKLPVENIPTRLGYVIRCSKTKAVYRNNKTYIAYDNDDQNDTLVELEEQTPESVKLLKQLYYEENITDNIINYGRINFSLNAGDYMKPIL